MNTWIKCFHIINTQTIHVELSCVHVKFTSCQDVFGAGIAAHN